MIGVSTGEILASLPIAAAAGGVAGIIYRSSGDVLNLVGKLSKAVSLGIRGDFKRLKEYYLYYKNEKSTECKSLKIIRDFSLILLSALIFSLVSYILLDGALRIAMLISFLAGFSALHALGTKILSPTVRGIGAFLTAMLVAVGRIICRIWRFLFFF